MPKRTDLKSVLIIGAGPIIIGQACEFDYSGTQACRVLREEGYRVILVNSNPATIMTDPEFADRTYIEPITPDFVAKIIERERPDAILPTMGGQTALNVAVALAENGTLEKFGVELIGAKLDAINKAENRELFQKTIREIGLDTPRGIFVRSLDEALSFAETTGFPIIIRPSFTLGGTGGGTAYNIDEFRVKVEQALAASPIHETLVEESVIGWKEFELEVMRDLKDNVVIVCSIENLDPMGVHTGDSITVAPAQTLTDREYQSMRDAAKKIIRAIGVETGGSNIQFAVNPADGRMLVIEMNPRVSRSSALASKATGFPIAKIAAKLSIGYTLDEIPNDITKKTPASFEPTIDYCVVKVPRWDFEKFKGVDDTLGIQMKSVGEAMAIGRTFKEALQKALRSLETGRSGLGADGKDKPLVLAGGGVSPEAFRALTVALRRPTVDRIFNVRYAIKIGFGVREISSITGIDPWFLFNIKQIVECEEDIRSAENIAAEPELLRKAKQYGFSDRQIATLCSTDEMSVRSLRKSLGITPVFKTVDTCAAEFEAETPYHYSTYDTENEVKVSDRKKVVILGGGPNRIGQGIEFDYCCVHGAFALKEEGFETIMVNCNPETVSTDYDQVDKLYFEPLTLENVLDICETEKPVGVIVSFGGQTPLRLAKALEANGVKILGTSSEGIDIAEDRKRFGDLLKKLQIPHPTDGTATNEKEALAVAASIGYPVLVRPSYVLGGRGMEIIYKPNILTEYVRAAVDVSTGHPILIDKFLEDAKEFDIDAVCDGDDVLIGGVMQHIEEAGIHSGDSACVLSSQTESVQIMEQLKHFTRTLAYKLEVRGLVNIQCAEKGGIVYLLEVNPRASRTVPFVSKATGVPLAKLAARVMVGRKLRDLGFPLEVSPVQVAVKVPVFPFRKFPGAKVYLGPEMRSTGEVMAISDSYGEAISKAYIAAGGGLPPAGGIFISVNDNDKNYELVEVARAFVKLGFTIVATTGTMTFLRKHSVECGHVFRINEGRPNIVDLIKNTKVTMILNTPLGEASRTDEINIGATALDFQIPMITTVSAAAAAIKGIQWQSEKKSGVRSIQEYHRQAATK
jgi:carbamoyl-phosphate synthase large subunit